MAHTARLWPPFLCALAACAPAEVAPPKLATLAQAVGVPAALQPFPEGRGYHAAALLPNGRVLLVGGVLTGYLSSAVELDPNAGAWSPAGTRPGPLAASALSLVPLKDGRVLAVGGRNAAGSHADTAFYDPRTRAWSAGPAMGTARGIQTATLLRDGRVLVAGGNTATPSAELFDPASETWQPTGPMVVARETHTATLLEDGRVLVLGGFSGGATDSAEVFDPATNKWSALSTKLPGARYWHTATRLLDGRVLVVGGYDGAASRSDSQLFEPKTGAWTTGPNLNTPLSRHTATLLPDGTVLLTGGAAAFNGGDARNAVVVLDAAAGAGLQPPLATARYWHTATQLPDGHVVLAGGFDLNGAALASAEVISPAIGTWQPAPAMRSKRDWAAAVTLLDGRVLITGGNQTRAVSDEISIPDCELFDPTAGTFTATGALARKRQHHTATLMPDGTVWAIGGTDARFALTTTVLSSVERWDPATGAWEAQPSLRFARTDHTTTLLQDGRLLVVGGADSEFINSAPVKTTELFDPATRTWSFGPPLGDARQQHAAVRLRDGRVLVVGGYGPFSSRTCELFDPVTNTWSPAAATLESHQELFAVLLGDGRVLISPTPDMAETAEVYDPVKNVWRATPKLPMKQYDGSLVRLLDGRALYVSGRSTNGTPTPRSSLYDPLLDRWEAGPALTLGRWDSSAALLRDGRVAFFGGFQGGEQVADVDVLALPRPLPAAATIAATSSGVPGGPLYVCGSGFASASEAGTGDFRSASTQAPVLYLRSSAEPSDEQLLPLTEWADARLTARVPAELAPGIYWARVGVGGRSTPLSAPLKVAPGVVPSKECLAAMGGGESASLRLQGDPLALPVGGQAELLAEITTARLTALTLVLEGPAELLGAVTESAKASAKQEGLKVALSGLSPGSPEHLRLPVRLLQQGDAQTVRGRLYDGDGVELAADEVTFDVAPDGVRTGCGCGGAGALPGVLLAALLAARLLRRPRRGC